MAYIVQLSPPQPLSSGQTLSQIINVSQPVGVPGFGGVNLYDDVAAVQGLIQIAVSGGTGLAQPFPTVTGSFDTMTGYYIFDQQVSDRQSFPNSIVDGIVSPASESGGICYTTGGVWTIVGLNVAAANANYAEWQALVQNYAQNAPET